MQFVKEKKKRNFYYKKEIFIPEKWKKIFLLELLKSLIFFFLGREIRTLSRP